MTDLPALSSIYPDFSNDDGHGDKGTAHSYIEIYEEILRPFRDCETVYEIGVAYGLSLRMWREYFTKARIFGIDTDPKFYNVDRITVFRADGTKFDPGFPLDVVIDDGSHKGHEQSASFDLLWPRCTGIYIIEDLKKPFRDFEYFHGGKREDDGIAWKLK